MSTQHAHARPRRRPVVESLEGRALLSTIPGTFAGYRGVIDSPGGRDRIGIEVRPEDVTTTRPWLLVRFTADADAGSMLDPGTLGISSRRGFRALMLSLRPDSIGGRARYDQ